MATRYNTQYPPKGMLVDMGGYRLHLHSTGTGQPAVVLEASIWDTSLTWALVQPKVAGFTHAISYDRGGYGWSASSPRPRTAEAMVEELHTLLSRAVAAPPYILVGQSFSGLLVRLFAYKYPQEVAGLVLLDPAHEDQDLRFPEAIRTMAAQMFPAQVEGLKQQRAAVESQGPGAVPAMFPVPAQFPKDVADLYQSHLAPSVARLDAMIGELDALDTSRAQVRAARGVGLGAIPLVVISHGQPVSVPGMPDEVNREYEATWQQLHAEQTAMSSQGQRIIAEGSGHMVQHDQPDLVAEVLQRMVEAAREQSDRS
jgi:pimeloyl-ACP methyl ester carboxylesterase